MQYTAKILRLRFAENFVRNFIAINPEKYANIKPEITEIIEIASLEIKILEFLPLLQTQKQMSQK